MALPQSLTDLLFLLRDDVELHLIIESPIVALAEAPVVIPLSRLQEIPIIADDFAFVDPQLGPREIDAVDLVFL